MDSVCTVFEDEIWREIQNDRTYLRGYGVVGDVEGLAAPQVLVRHRRGLLAVNLVREVDVAAFHEPAQFRIESIRTLITYSIKRSVALRLTNLLVAAL